MCVCVIVRARACVFVCTSCTEVMVQFEASELEHGDVELQEGEHNADVHVVRDHLSGMMVLGTRVEKETMVVGSKMD